jgi:hypothetical protein
MSATSEILEALIALSDSRIWATELAFFSGTRRIDFWTLEPTYSQGFRTSAYEIKVSRADYQRDSEAKQDGALKWSDRFWYVTPPNLISPKELPEWAGLQEWDGTLFRVKRKAPPRKKADPDWEFIVSLLRNSGDCRRDVGLMKTQIAFLQSRLDMWTRQRKTASEANFARWMEKSKAVSTPTTEGDRR